MLITHSLSPYSVSFSATSSHLGASLTLAHVTIGMTCVVDFNFTMVNREHFTKNDVYSERSCQFTLESPVSGDCYGECNCCYCRPTFT